jgi:Tfp pilus assembly protein PilO
MLTDFRLQKRAIIGLVVLLVLADAALVVYSWQVSSVTHTPEQQLALQTRQYEVLKGDVKRAQEIRADMPAIRQDCDEFERSLFPASTGYSQVSAELDSIARKAGLQIEDRALKQKDIPSRGLTEITVDATVAGPYSSVIAFLNGLQRSKDFFEVDGLTAGAEAQSQATGGPIRVAVHMKTFFRTAA